MSRRSVITIGDLQPSGTAKPFGITPYGRQPTHRRTAAACIPLALAALAGLAIWSEPNSEVTVVPAITRPAADTSIPSFPSWVDVPPLGRPRGDGASREANGSRSFLAPQSGAVIDRPQSLLPRANPRLPLIGFDPILTEHAVSERTMDRGGDRERLALSQAVSVPLADALADAVPTHGPSETRPSRTAGDTSPTLVIEAATALVRPPDVRQVQDARRLVPTVAPAPPPEPVHAPGFVAAKTIHDQRGETAGTLPPSAVTSTQSAPVAALDPVQLRSLPGQADPIARSRPSDDPSTAPRVSVAAKRAWSPRLRRARLPPVRGEVQIDRSMKIDAGIVAHNSFRRARPVAPLPPSGSPETWTLPPALSQTD